MTQQASGKWPAILLTIFVTFILTALGVIVAMRFLGQTPPAVTEATDQVLERLTPPQEKAVVPKTDSELVAEAVAANAATTVTIFKKLGENPTKEQLAENFVARGILVSADGLLATSQAAVGERSNYVVMVPGLPGSQAATFVSAEEGVAILRIEHAPKKVADLDGELPKVEQIVVAMAGDVTRRTAMGIVEAITQTENSTMNIATSIIDEVFPGSPLLALDGKVVGFSLTATPPGRKVSFTPVMTVKNALARAKK